MPKLRVIANDKSETLHELDGEIVIGRLAPADVVLPDPKVSRRHCRIYTSGAGYMVEDLGSSNGIRVNGRAVKASPLKPGDRIDVGQTTLVYEVERKTPNFGTSTRKSARERMRGGR